MEFSCEPRKLRIPVLYAMLACSDTSNPESTASLSTEITRNYAKSFPQIQDQNIKGWALRVYFLGGCVGHTDLEATV